MSPNDTLKRPLEDDKVEFATDMFKLLGHPLRLRLVELLDRNGESNVNELAEETQTPQSTVSLYLNRLKTSGLLGKRKDGKQTFYFIIEPRLGVLLNCLRGCPID